MIIETKYPFDKNKHKVYLTNSSDNRMRCYVYENNNMVDSMAYARYLAMTEIAHDHIPKGYEVDHIDGNVLNNSLNNLQIITGDMNLLKQRYDTCHFRLYVRLICPYCSRQFDYENNNFLIKIRTNKFISCSRSCSRKLLKKSQTTHYIGSPFRPYYEYILGYFYNFDEIIKCENIMKNNGVKFIKRY